MRVAEWMDISQGAVDRSARDLKRSNDHGRIDIALAAGENSAVPGILQQGRRPANFQVQTDLDIHIASTQGLDEARLGYHEVGVFRPFGKDRQRGLLATNLLGQAAEFGNRGTDFERLGLGERGQPQAGNQTHECYDRDKKTDHQHGLFSCCSLRIGARHGPRTATRSRARCCARRH